MRIVLAEIQLKLQFAILDINYGINKWCNLVLKISEAWTKVNTWIQKIPYWSFVYNKQAKDFCISSLIIDFH